MPVNDFFSETVNYRRAVRKFHSSGFEKESVRKSLELAILSPSSSNMHLYQFIRITNAELKKKVAFCCLNQSAASTATELIVLAIRPDLYKRRASFNLQKIMELNPERKSLDGKGAEYYYSKLIPLLYFNDRFGFVGIFRKLVQFFRGMRKPTVREVSKNDIRIVLHKSAALAAQTFMLSMASAKQDTCPIEGYDSKRLKKLLNLNKDSEINMVIACGIRDIGGIYNERIRTNLEEMVTELS